MTFLPKLWLWETLALTGMEFITLPGIFHLGCQFEHDFVSQWLSCIRNKAFKKSKVGTWDQQSTLVDNCLVILGRKESVCNFTF